jgi:hypothetical protein
VGFVLMPNGTRLVDLRVQSVRNGGIQKKTSILPSFLLPHTSAAGSIHQLLSHSWKTAWSHVNDSTCTQVGAAGSNDNSHLLMLCGVFSSGGSSGSFESSPLGQGLKKKQLESPLLRTNCARWYRAACLQPPWPHLCSCLSPSNFQLPPRRRLHV